jgi:hypothetical protein
MRFRLGAKWTNRHPTLKEASGNHDAQSHHRTGSVHYQGFCAGRLRADERVEEHTVGDRTQVHGSDLLFGLPMRWALGYALDLRSPGRRRAERDARDPPDNFADRDSDAAVGSCVWPAPGVQKAHIELAGGRSRSQMSLIIPDDRQPFYPDLRERIKVGDELLVVAPEDQRGKIEDRLRMWPTWSARPLTRRTKNELGGSMLP